MSQSLKAEVPRGRAPQLQVEHKLLIVDDDPLALRALEKALRGEGYDVHTARSIDEAKRLIRGDEFDAALIDLCLDGGRGALLVSELRAASRPCCAVMITGTTRGDAARQAIAAGAEDFLIKPVQTELLLDSIRRTIHRTRVWRMQVDRIEGRTDAPKPQLSVVAQDEATLPVPPDRPTPDRTDTVLAASGMNSRLVAWPPLPTLKALDIDRCADALAQIGGLTDRERNILVPLLRGEHNSDIAQLTGASERTVKFHVSNIFKKLRVTQRCELLRFFF